MLRNKLNSASSDQRYLLICSPRRKPQTQRRIRELRNWWCLYGPRCVINKRISARLLEFLIQETVGGCTKKTSFKVLKGSQLHYLKMTQIACGMPLIPLREAILFLKSFLKSLRVNNKHTWWMTRTSKWQFNRMSRINSLQNERKNAIASHRKWSKTCPRSWAVAP